MAQGWRFRSTATRGRFKQRLGASRIGGSDDLGRRLAAHYAGRGPERVFFEFRTSPEVHDATVGRIQHGLCGDREARAAADDIATGANYSDIVDLLTVHPLSDGNVIYPSTLTIPHEFTHQGRDGARRGGAIRITSPIRRQKTRCRSY